MGVQASVSFNLSISLAKCGGLARRAAWRFCCILIAVLLRDALKNEGIIHSILGKKKMVIKHFDDLSWVSV